VRAEPAVGQQPEQGGREDGERQQYQDAGEQDVPGEDRHPEHGHARRTQAHDRGHHVDRAQDRAESAEHQPAGHEEAERGDQVQNPDQLVVGGRHHPQQRPALRRPAGHRHGHGRRSERGHVT
jgi:hypothetical protein